MNRWGGGVRERAHSNVGDDGIGLAAVTPYFHTGVAGSTARDSVVGNKTVEMTLLTSWLAGDAVI